MLYSIVKYGVLANWFLLSTAVRRGQPSRGRGMHALATSATERATQIPRILLFDFPEVTALMLGYHSHQDNLTWVRLWTPNGKPRVLDLAMRIRHRDLQVRMLASIHCLLHDPLALNSEGGV